uniref:U4/U6.U5 small nuclear ribonucleoprotein 27 kDa protein n=1 Tax=Rhabditophanes sp. KR3021 TaxID=114890 RepID=A0AC35UF88_9BILA
MARDRDGSDHSTNKTATRSPVKVSRKRSHSPRGRVRSRSPVEKKTRYDSARNDKKVPSREDEYASRKRKRSFSPLISRKRSYSPPLVSHQELEKNAKVAEKLAKDKAMKPIKTKPIDLESMDCCEAEMQRLMGFGSFSTTKNTKVEGNDVGCANVKKSRKYRQYMNRKGGFNRALDNVG